MQRVTRRLVVQGVGAAGLALAAGCARWPFGASPARVPHIGLLGAVPMSPGPEALRQGLQELGYRDGETMFLDTRWTEGEAARARQFAAELVQLPVDLIVAPTPLEAQAAQQATTTIPIVTVVVGDPVGTGLVASLARPSGNITGLTMMTTPLGTKRLELLTQAVPGVGLVAVLWNPAAPEKVLEWQEMQQPARLLGVQLLSLEVRAPDDLNTALQLAARQQVHALMPLAEPVVFSQRARILAFAAEYQLPALYAWREFAQAGGLMAYGPSITANYQRAAYYVDRILKGAKPADLPVEQPMFFEFIVNLRTAQTLGLTIPQSVLLQATEVIQ